MSFFLPFSIFRRETEDFLTHFLNLRSEDFLGTHDVLDELRELLLPIGTGAELYFIRCLVLRRNPEQVRTATPDGEDR